MDDQEFEEFKISSELLSKILEKEAYSEDAFMNQDEYTYSKRSYKFTGDHINVFALAHKCKVWAHKCGYEISSSQGDFAGIKIKHKNVIVFESHTTTEQEPVAIIKACNWVFEQTNKEVL